MRLLKKKKFLRDFSCWINIILRALQILLNRKNFS